MRVANPPKAVIIVFGMGLVGLLMAIGKVTPEAGLPLISAGLFYGIGNGVAARRGIPVDPVLGPSDTDA
jgi:hypothetical protein